MTKTYLKNKNALEDEIVELFIEKYKDKIIYNDLDYQSCVNFVKESKYFILLYSYDNYMTLLNVNI